jgi:hypothetical protein
MKIQRNIFVILTVTTMLASCTDLGGPFVAPRLHPGHSIDGVQLGDHLAQVEATLGRGNLGGMDGVYSWTSASYREGPHAGMVVAYWDWPKVPYRVDFIRMDTLYTGTSLRGNGIGSTVTSFRRELGMPQRSIVVASDGRQIDAYCIQGVGFHITYKQGRARSFYMGNFFPTSTDTLCR